MVCDALGFHVSGDTRGQWAISASNHDLTLTPSDITASNFITSPYAEFSAKDFIASNGTTTDILTSKADFYTASTFSNMGSLSINNLATGQYLTSTTTIGITASTITIPSY
jgi:hypothetical protein